MPEKDKLVTLHDPKGNTVYVNPDYVTFIQKNPSSDSTIVGLVGDDLGCDVSETPEQVAALLGVEQPAPKIDRRRQWQRKERSKPPL